MLRYLHQLFRGHVLRALARLTRRPSPTRPQRDLAGRPVADVALMTLRVAQGRRDAAEALAETVESAPDDAFDPWWMHGAATIAWPG